MSAIQTLIPVLGGLLAGLGALGAVLWLAPRHKGTISVMSAEPDILSEPRRFRFRNGYLVENSENVAFLLPSPIDRLCAWDTLAAALAQVNAGIPAAFEALHDQGRPFKLSGLFGRDRITVLGLRDGPDLRVTVASAEERHTSVRIDLPSLEAMEAEIAMLSRAGDTSPALAWAVDAEGQVVWSNAAYLALVARCEGRDAAAAWPLRALFPLPEGQPAGTSRRKARDRAGDELWFEVNVSAPENGLRHVHALSLEAVIRAEESLRTFIQTLTKSFAHLPMGIAIFDRTGRLALFNPALVDMTDLDAGWLSRKPLLADVFDCLRDRHRIPEPRDYKTWRDGLAEMGHADGGAHQETWPLPGGLTYRVTARPQGDGAMTLFLEDVSASIAASRLHREERDMLSRLLDDVDDALVVFDAGGDRIISNGAATALWRNDAGELPATLDGCLAYWRALSRPSRIWGDLRAMLAQPATERAGWTDTLVLHSGEALRVAVSPLPGGRVALSCAPIARAKPRDVLAPARALQA